MKTTATCRVCGKGKGPICPTCIRLRSDARKSVKADIAEANGYGAGIANLCLYDAKQKGYA